MDNEVYQRITEGLKVRGRRNQEVLSLLKFDWPLSVYVLERITEYISDHIKLNEEPVVYEIIEGALNKYSMAVHDRRGEKVVDAVRFGIFIESLISETYRVMDLEVKDEKGSQWSVGCGTSFCVWLEQCSGELTVTGNKIVSETLVRKTLYDIITNEKIRNVLRKVNYENTVVGGDRNLISGSGDDTHPNPR